MSNAVENMSSKWIEFVTPEILSEIQGMFGSDMTMETLKSFSYEYLAPEIKMMINKEISERQEKKRASQFEEEKKCSACGKVLVVEEANGQKYFTCQDATDLFHREGISKQSLEEDKAWLEENGYHEELMKEELAKKLYKNNKAKGLHAWMELQGQYYSKRAGWANGYFNKVWTQKVLVKEISEKAKTEGTIVTAIYNKKDLDIVLKTDLKFWKPLKVESIGYGHVPTMPYEEWHSEYEKTQYMTDTITRDRLQKKLSDERSRDFAETEGFLLTMQRINTTFDDAILEKYIMVRNSGKHKYFDATSMIPQGESLQIYDPTYRIIHIDGTRAWCIARTKILAKKGLLKSSSRSVSGDVSTYVDKVNQYRYVPEDAMFMTSEQLDNLLSARNNNNKELGRKTVQEIEEKYPELKGSKWRYQPIDGEIFAEKKSEEVQKI